MLNIQATGNLYGQIITVKQISKPAARKLFNAGIDIYLQTSNFYPFGFWQNLMVAGNGENNTFDYLCNSFRWYNCDSERGRYIHFYTKIGGANDGKSI